MSNKILLALTAWASSLIFFMKGDILTLKNLYMTYPRILFKKYNTQFLLTPMDKYIDKVCDVYMH